MTGSAGGRKKTLVEKAGGSVNSRFSSVISRATNGYTGAVSTVTTRAGHLPIPPSLASHNMLYLVMK